MRLTEIRRSLMVLESETVPIIRIVFECEGMLGALMLDPPSSWSEWEREEKLVWCRQQVQEHLGNYNYPSPQGIIFPDMTLPGGAKNEFENLPGWATWTAAEATDWIEQNVNNLTEAKQVLKKMAQAIIYLRDIVIER